MIKNRRQRGAIWIVKPAARSRGKGIFLFRKLKDLAEWKSREIKLEQLGIPTEIYVVQRYIDNPYLVAGLNSNLLMRCSINILIITLTHIKHISLCVCVHCNFLNITLNMCLRTY